MYFAPSVRVSTFTHPTNAVTVTGTLAVKVCPDTLSVRVAVTVVLPAATPVTVAVLPLPETVATEALSVVHATV